MSTDPGKAIYESGAYSGQNSVKHKLSGANTKISCLKYEWLVSYVLKEDEKKVVVSATMNSRYLFLNTLTLIVHLEQDGKELKKEEFKLEKIAKKQEFEVLLDNTLELPTIDVYATVRTGSFTYYTNAWSTEVNFKVNRRAHDVIISVGETKFYLHKIYLATWSKFFDRLFFGDFKEKDQKEVKLEEVDAEEFEQMLLLMYPQSSKVLGETKVLKVLKLADRFEIPHLMVRCGDLLSSFDKCKDVSLMDRLELGDKHNLIQLQVACFERIHKMTAQERINFFDLNRARINELSERTVKNLI